MRFCLSIWINEDISHAGVARRQSSCFTSWSAFQPTTMAMSPHWWPKDWCRITSSRYEEGTTSSFCFFMSEAASWGVAGICRKVNLPLEVYRADPNGRKLEGWSRTHWRDFISHLAWEHPGLPQKELWRGVFWMTCLVCCHHDLTPDKQKQMDRRKTNFLLSM